MQRVDSSWRSTGRSFHLGGARQLRFEPLEDRCLLAVYYIATTGDDTAAGTIDHPWKTIYRSWATATTDDTVYLRDGVHRYVDSDGDWISWSTQWTCDATYTSYPGETAWIQSSFQFNWTQIDSRMWKADSLGAFVSEDANENYNYNVNFADRTNAVKIYNLATCVNGGTTSLACVGDFEGRGVHNDRIYYTYGSYYLFWDGTYWRIAASLSDTTANYWYLNVANATTPRSDTAFTSVGTCAGSPRISYAEVPTVGNPAIPADFASPPMQTADSWGTITFYDDSGNLLYDLCYLDVVNDVLYLRSADILPITDPASQAFAENPKYDPYVYADGLTFDGVSLKPGFCYSSKTGAANVTFKNALLAPTFVGAHTNALSITSCDFSYGNGNICYDQIHGVYGIDNQAHTIYTSGTTGDAYRDNFFAPSPAGPTIHFYPNTCTNYDFADNVIYGWQSGIVLWKGTGNTIRNNVIICEPRWMTASFEQTPYVSCYVFRIGAGGLTASPIEYNYIESYYKVFVVEGSSSSQTIDHNIVVMPYDNGQPILTLTDATITSMDYNLFVCDGAHGAIINGVTYTQAQFQAWLISHGWTHNVFINSTEAIDPVAAQAFLATSPTFDEKCAYFRQWALRFTNYADRGPVLNLVYEGHSQAVTTSTMLQLIDSTGQVIIDGRTIDISKQDDVLTWDGQALVSGDIHTFVTGKMLYTVTYSGDGVVVVDVQIHGTHIFYNNSKWDAHTGYSTGDSAANAYDDNAIAYDKNALMPGETAAFENYTSYVRGINGIMIDFDQLPGNLTASDFEFKIGNSNDPAAWTTAASPRGITVRAVGGVYRVTITWEDGAIKKQWLRATVKANSNTGLATDYVFYYGNAIGETGNAATNAIVNATDELAARNHATVLTAATVSNPYDFSRDKLVNATDQLIARNNQTVLAALKLITPPVLIVTDDSIATNEDTAVAIAVLANDSDVAGATLDVSQVSVVSALGAAVTVNADKTISYNPAVSARLQALSAGQTALDSLTYTVKDSSGRLGKATVKVCVTGRNEPVGGKAGATTVSAIGNVLPRVLTTGNKAAIAAACDNIIKTAMLSNRSSLFWDDPDWLDDLAFVSGTWRKSWPVAASRLADLVLKNLVMY